MPEKSIDSRIEKGQRSPAERLLSIALGVILCVGLFAGISLSLSGCGSEEGAQESAQSSASAESGTSAAQEDEDAGQGAAYKYVKLLASSDSTYYMKASVVTTITAENETTKDIVESAQTKDKQMISSESNSYIQYYLSGKQYYYDTLTMKYYELGTAGAAGKVDQAYAPVTGYKETKDAEFGGTACKCDVYENEAVYDGTKVMTTMEYYVAGGELVGIVSTQTYRADKRTISKVTMTIEKFTTDIPEGTFDPPSGFEKAQ